MKYGHLTLLADAPKKKHVGTFAFSLPLWSETGWELKHSWNPEMESTGKVGRVSLPALAPLPVDCPVRQKKIPILYKQLYFQVSLRQQFIEVKKKKKACGE